MAGLIPPTCLCFTLGELLALLSCSLRKLAHMLSCLSVQSVFHKDCVLVVKGRLGAAFAPMLHLADWCMSVCVCVLLPCVYVQ